MSDPRTVTVYGASDDEGHPWGGRDHIVTCRNQGMVLLLERVS